jgi:hypothetical protein
MHKLIPKGTNINSSAKTDHRSDHSVIQIADGFTTSCNGNRVLKTTTRGWSLLASWKDRSSDWMSLKDLKDCYPIQIAKYVMANKIANEAPFNLWVHPVVRKRNRIVAKIKRFWRTTNKFCVSLPKTVAEALAINNQTGTDFWQKALGKEMKKVKGCLDSCRWRVARASPSRQGTIYDQTPRNAMSCDI